MNSIVRAGENDTRILSQIAVQTFIESHGHSADPQDIDAYSKEKYDESIVVKELRDPENIYHILYADEQAAGYSKIMLNCPYQGCTIKNITKLERLYLLKSFYDLKLGGELFRFNLELMKKNNQAGVWLYVWKENQRAINFYLKNGFKIIGSHDFRISPTHTNPNHQMLLLF